MQMAHGYMLTSFAKTMNFNMIGDRFRYITLIFASLAAHRMRHIRFSGLRMATKRPR